MTAASLHLRAAVASDLDAILALERATDHAPHWPPGAYEAILNSTDLRRCVMVALRDEAIAGFAVGLLHPGVHGSTDRIAELESVVVAASARRAGIGFALCESVFDWGRSQGATEVILEARAASHGAIALYFGLGFTQTGRRPRYYRDPEDDAVVMRLRLDLRDLREEGR